MSLDPDWRSMISPGFAWVAISERLDAIGDGALVADVRSAVQAVLAEEPERNTERCPVGCCRLPAWKFPPPVVPGGHAGVVGGEERAGQLGQTQRVGVRGRGWGIVTTRWVTRCRPCFAVIVKREHLAPRSVSLG